MNKRFIAAVAALGIAQFALIAEKAQAQSASPDFDSLASHGVTHVVPVPLPDFINTVEQFTPDGKAAHIIKSMYRDHWTYMFTTKHWSNIIFGCLRSAKNCRLPPDQEIIPFQHRATEPSGLFVRDATIDDDEQNGRVILVARAMVDGKSQVVVLAASQETSGPSHVWFVIYRYAVETGLDMERPEFHEAVWWRSVEPYCKVRVALQTAMGDRVSGADGQCK
jgi:hypothetical protein